MEYSNDELVDFLQLVVERSDSLSELIDQFRQAGIEHDELKMKAEISGHAFDWDLAEDSARELAALGRDLGEALVSYLDREVPLVPGGDLGRERQKESGEADTETPRQGSRTGYATPLDEAVAESIRALDDLPKSVLAGTEVAGAIERERTRLAGRGIARTSVNIVAGQGGGGASNQRPRRGQEGRQI
jgi:hypothetical protein